MVNLSQVALETDRKVMFVRAGVAVLLMRYKKKYFRAKFILFPGRGFPAAAGVEDWLATR